MKVDRYTNTVLTIIAVALIVLAWQNVFEIKSAIAQGTVSKVSKVALCDKSGRYCLDVFPATTLGGQDLGVRVGVLSRDG